MVVLIHGMRRSGKSLAKIQNSLELMQYKVIALDYPSYKHSIDYLAQTIAQQIKEANEKHLKKNAYPGQRPSKIHFITHSMGGVLLRRMFEKHYKPKNLGKIVMLAPPNAGTPIADMLHSLSIYQFIFGPAGTELSTGENSILPEMQDVIDYPLGIIIGTKSLNPIASLLIKGGDDGLIPHENSKIKNMADFVEIPASHSFIMYNEDAVKQAIWFLEYGLFNHQHSTTQYSTTQ